MSGFVPIASRTVFDERNVARVFITQVGVALLAETHFDSAQTARQPASDVLGHVFDPRPERMR